MSCSAARIPMRPRSRISPDGNPSGVGCRTTAPMRHWFSVSSSVRQSVRNRDLRDSRRDVRVVTEIDVIAVRAS
jgi:hypothetical protein